MVPLSPSFKVLLDACPRCASEVDEGYTVEAKLDPMASRNVAHAHGDGGQILDRGLTRVLLTVGAILWHRFDQGSNDKIGCSMMAYKCWEWLSAIDVTWHNEPRTWPELGQDIQIS